MIPVQEMARTILAAPDVVVDGHAVFTALQKEDALPGPGAGGAASSAGKKKGKKYAVVHASPAKHCPLPCCVSFLLVHPTPKVSVIVEHTRRHTHSTCLLWCSSSCPAVWWLVCASFSLHL